MLSNHFGLKSKSNKHYKQIKIWKKQGKNRESSIPHLKIFQSLFPLMMKIRRKIKTLPCLKRTPSNTRPSSAKITHKWAFVPIRLSASLLMAPTKSTLQEFTLETTTGQKSVRNFGRKESVHMVLDVCFHIMRRRRKGKNS